MKRKRLMAWAGLVVLMGTLAIPSRADARSRGRDDGCHAEDTMTYNCFDEDYIIFRCFTDCQCVGLEAECASWMDGSGYVACNCWAT